MKKVDLIKDRCIGCGACMTIAPDNFTFDDDGRAELISKEVTEAAIDASETCPVSAIIIENNNCSENCNCENNCECGEECTCEEKCNCTDECTCGENCNCSKNNKCSENCNCNE